MKVTSRNQKGFSFVEIVIVVIVLVIIGVLGYRFFSRQPQATSTNNAATTNAKIETSSIQSDLNGIDVDKTIDTTTVDEALQ